MHSTDDVEKERDAVSLAHEVRRMHDTISFQRATAGPMKEQLI